MNAVVLSCESLEAYVSAAQYAAGTGTWESVVTAFVAGWKNEYAAAH